MMCESIMWGRKDHCRTAVGGPAERSSAVRNLMLIFSSQAHFAPPFLPRRAALAALVPCLHESTLTRPARNLLCYNFFTTAPAQRSYSDCIGEARRVASRPRQQMVLEQGQAVSSRASAPKESQIIMASAKNK